MRYRQKIICLKLRNFLFVNVGKSFRSISKLDFRPETFDPKSTPSQVQINFDVDELRTFKISSRSITYAPQAKIVEPELSA